MHESRRSFFPSQSCTWKLYLEYERLQLPRGRGITANAFEKRLLILSLVLLTLTFNTQVTATYIQSLTFVMQISKCNIDINLI